MPAVLRLTPGLMTTTQLVLGNAAQAVGLIPIAWLGWGRLRGQRADVAYWWLAGAFAVSFVADLIAHYVTGHPFVARLYPMTQGVIVLATILARHEALMVLAVLTVTAIAGLLGNPLPNDDLLLRIVAFGTVAGVVWPLRSLGRLRTALLVYFGGGVLCWTAYVIAPGWTTWTLYQLTRVAGVVLFCRAVARPRPMLRIARRAA